MSSEPEELPGVVKSVWTKDDNSFCIITLKDKTKCIGTPPSEGIVRGGKYLFSGKWSESGHYGMQFRFTAAALTTPASRDGVVQYLKKYAPFVGDSTAHAIVDRFGAEAAVDALKSNPVVVAAQTRGLTEERARKAAEALREQQKFQQTKVELLGMLANRGFGDMAFGQCIKEWGVNCPAVIRRNPFLLMTHGIFGAGYLRCDRLWHEFGLPPEAMKRQVMAVAWHLKSDNSGSTWFRKEDVIETIRSVTTGMTNPDRAIRIAMRAGMIKQEEEGGRLWIAAAERASEERELCRDIVRLMEWPRQETAK